MPSFSRKKLLLLGFLFVTLLVIPLTVYLVQQQQELRSRANATTTLSLTPAENVASVGAKFDLDVWVSPGENQVNFIKLVLKYDANKLQTTADSFVLDPTTNFSLIQNPTINAEGNGLSVVLSISDPTKVIQENMKIGTISFEVIGSSDTPTEVSFDRTQIQIRSLSSTDSFKENVFQSGTPAVITIQSGEIAPTPTATPSATPTPDLSPTPTSTPSADGATPADNQAPVCSTLTTDRTPSGVAPFSLTFTATGSDTDGTVSKVTFNFGDGPVEDVTTGGGLGTSTISLAKSHTYNNGGTFTATAMLTDDRNGTSDTTNCTVTVTTDGTTPTASDGATPIPATGPNNTVVGIGVLGGILFLIGTLLFFAL